MPHRKTHSPSEPVEVTRSFRVPLAHDEAMKRIARRNQRTLSGELRLLIEAHLEAHATELGAEDLPLEEAA